MEASTRTIEYDFKKHLIADSEYVIQRRGSGASFYTAQYFELMKRKYRDETGDFDTKIVKEIDYELDTDQLKILVHFSNRIYHFIVDTLSLVMKIKSLYPDIKIVLFTTEPLRKVESSTFYKTLIEVFKYLDIDYFVAEDSENDNCSKVYKIKNFITTDSRWFDYHRALTLLDVEAAVSCLKDLYLIKPCAEPFRKVYLKRLPADEVIGSIYTGDGSYSNDLRMYDEDELTDYFLANGYEIVTPEDKFATLAEQINYMSEVSDLAAISSSGLINCLFMQPGQRVIEILAEIVNIDYLREDGLLATTQRLPMEYYPLSFLLGHSHIMISTKRNAIDAIYGLESLNGI